MLQTFRQRSNHLLHHAAVNAIKPNIKQTVTVLTVGVHLYSNISHTSIRILMTK